MTGIVVVTAWLALGIIGVVVGVLNASEDEPAYYDMLKSYGSERKSSQFLMTISVLLGPIGLLGSTLMWFSDTVQRAKKEKKKVAEELERELRDAKAEIDALLRKKAAP